MRTVVVGGQYGDEGKGKMVSYLALSDKPDVVARGGVGPNAGHEVWHLGKRYPMRMIPSGFIYGKCEVVIGAGVLVNPEVFLTEIQNLGISKRAYIDKRCAIIEKKHIDEDSSSPISKKIGTTKTGCGPAVRDRVSRSAKLASEIPELSEFICDVAEKVNGSGNVIVEGSQGFMLSNLYGTYPYVTSKDVSASSICADVGLSPRKVDRVVMVIKAYTTRVGSGNLKGELGEEEAKSKGVQEYGTVTGRPRRVSLDLHFDDLRYACMVNGPDYIAITKVDVLFPQSAGVKRFSELNDSAKRFIEKVEKELGVPVALIGTGKEALDTIDRREELGL